MKRPIDREKRGKSKRSIRYGLDSHKWATKMEIRRLLSGKPDLNIKAGPKNTP